MPQAFADFELDFQPRLPRHKDRAIGCIGSGFIMADCHLVAYRQAGFNVRAISSRNPARAQEVAARHAVPKVYDTYQELLADREVRVVDVAVPPDVQLNVIEEIVRHADHVRGILAQKPLGANFAQARRIVELCKLAGIALAVNQNMRFDQSVRNLDTRLRQHNRIEVDTQRLVHERARLATELDKAAARAKRLDDSAHDVSRRLVEAMETVREVLAKAE